MEIHFDGLLPAPSRRFHFLDRKHPSLYQYIVMDLIQKEEKSSKCKLSPAWFEGASLTLMMIQFYD